MFDLTIENCDPFESMPESFPDWDVSFNGGEVLANICLINGRATIYKWWSVNEGRGASTRALIELKKKAGFVKIFDAMNEGFWNLMLSRSLVDELD